MTKRQPKGTPVGGQFAQDRKPESDVVLSEAPTPLDDLCVEIRAMGLPSSRDDAPNGSYSIDFNNAIVGSPFLEGTGWYPDLESAQHAADLVLTRINECAIRHLVMNPIDGESWSDPEKEALSSWATIVSAEDADGLRDGDPLYEEEYSGGQSIYKSQEARDAEAMSYGDRSYWDYLEESALDYARRGVIPNALSRSLSDALRGNEGI